MKKALTFSIIILTLLFSTSCGIIEKIFFNNNNGGTYSMTLELADLASLKDFSAEQKKLNDSTVHDEVLTYVRSVMGEVDGISNLKFEANKEKSTYSVLFDFSKIKSLNYALSAYYDRETEGQGVSYQEFFTQKRKAITKTELGQINRMAKDIELKEEGLIDFMKVVYKEFYHEIVIELEKNIRSISNDEYVMDDNKKIIRMRRNVFETEDLKKSTSVTIRNK